MLNEKGIGIYDTAKVVRRLKDNASDKFLEMVEPVNLAGLLEKMPQCSAIVITGQKSMDILISQFGHINEPRIGEYSEFQFMDRNMRLYRMPSSSRAYPKSVEAKSESYKKLLEVLNS